MRARNFASRKLLVSSRPVDAQLFIQTRATSSYSSDRAGLITSEFIVLGCAFMTWHRGIIATAASLQPRVATGSAGCEPLRIFCCWAVLARSARVIGTRRTTAHSQRKRRMSHTERAGLCRSIAFRDLAPVHGVPPRLEIVRAAVLVVEIIGVLPDIVAHQRALAVHDRTVLVRAGLDRKLAVLCDGHEHPA